MNWIVITILWAVSTIPVMAVLALSSAFSDANRLPRWQRVLMVAFAPITIVGAVLLAFPPTRFLLWGIYETFRK